MNTPRVIIIAIVVAMLGILLIFSQQHEMTAQTQVHGGAAGGYGAAPAGGYGGHAPAAGGYGAAPSAGGYGGHAPAAGGYGAAPSAGGGQAPAAGGYGK